MRKDGCVWEFSLLWVEILAVYCWSALTCSVFMAIQEHPWVPEVRPMVIPSDKLPYVSCSQPGKFPVPCKTRNDAKKQCRHTVVCINFYPGIYVIYIYVE